MRLVSQPALNDEMVGETVRGIVCVFRAACESFAGAIRSHAAYEIVFRHHKREFGVAMNPHDMNPISGEFVAFSDYLERTKRERSVSVLWKWSEIARNLAHFPAGERGSIALGHRGGGNSLSTAPGLSTTVQVVAPAARTKPHAHSFWHLYIVRSGNGLFFANESDEGSSLVAGDILFIPACTMHSFSNPAGEEPLILFAVQDLPHVAELGVLARQEAGGSLDLVYSQPNTGAAKETNEQPVRILHMQAF